ncbi:MAG: radical SAM protein, partial [Halobacteriota archaeon]|nr:radical SAM protein [Halobacteriota archaeon]
LDDLDRRIEELYSIFEECVLCPRKCKVNRFSEERGYCRSGKDLVVSSISPHFGEEAPLVGIYGSGTVFLSNCNLGCTYCQNYEISQFGHGSHMTTDELVSAMLGLQKRGCHNINFVTPTHFVPQLVKSIKNAAERGLKIPIVYNCGGYESVETLRLLEGIVDIYMPDMKYSDSENAKRYSNAPDYFEVCKDAVREMHSQVGDLKVNGGVAWRGLLIRHLLLPNDLAGSEEILKFVSELSKDSYINIMEQYRPVFKAYDYGELKRPLKMSEYSKVIEMAKELGLHRGFL